MNKEDFFSDENNPYVVRTNKSRLKKLRAGQYRSPFSTENNSDDLQSFEVAIAEQQVTDQVRFTRILPASADYFKRFSMNIAQWDVDIMQEFRGKYLDYEYNMRVERIQRQGRTYSCECCSDLDKLLYTQLAYTVPATTTWTSGEGTSEEKTIETVYPQASEHAKNIAKTLGLNFTAKENALFGDFLSTVLTDDMGGVTYNDLIRDIFGWSARIPHKMINVCIRNNQIFFIERGNEPNMIDISEAEKSEPIITRELVRTTWGSSVNSKTTTTEMTTKTYVPPDIVINTPDTPDTGDDEEQWTTIRDVSSGLNWTATTTYYYNRGSVAHSADSIVNKLAGLLSKVETTKSYNYGSEESDSFTQILHDYDKDGTRIGTSTYVHYYNGQNSPPDTRTENRLRYITLPNGEKYLSQESTARYEDDKL